jgi:hypothetical protein
MVGVFLLIDVFKTPLTKCAENVYDVLGFLFAKGHILKIVGIYF